MLQAWHVACVQKAACLAGEQAASQCADYGGWASPLYTLAGILGWGSWIGDPGLGILDWGS